MDISPDYTSNGRGGWICPLDRLYVPASHPQKEEFHKALLKISNKGSYPIHVNLTCFKLSPNTIDAIKSIKTQKSLTGNIIYILHNISLNPLPHKVEMFFRNCDTTKEQCKCTLIGSSGCLRASSRNHTGIHLGNLNLDFFFELTATPEDWPRLLASKQELLKKLISEKIITLWIHHIVRSE